MKALFCPWCICHFIEKQSCLVDILHASLDVPNSVLEWELINDTLWSPGERWRGLWIASELTMSSKLKMQCLNHEQYGSSSLHYPYVSTEWHDHMTYWVRWTANQLGVCRNTYIQTSELVTDELNKSQRSLPGANIQFDGPDQLNTQSNPV